MLAAMLLGHFMPRFGTAQRPALTRRRSKEEFVSAMASLLEQKADYNDAYRSVRADLLREWENTLGLPAGAASSQITGELARRGLNVSKALEQVLRTENLSASAGAQVFLRELNLLETARNEFYSGRYHRQTL
jgi:hypothetical protein